MNSEVIKTVPKKATKPKKRKSSGSLDVQKSRMGWLFIAPFLIGFFLVYLPMIFDSIKFSFSEIEMLDGGYVLNNVGFNNYQTALESSEFKSVLIGSITDLIFSVPAIVIFALFMAVLLNQKMRGRAIFRAIFFIPVIVSTGIIESIDAKNTLASIQQNGNLTEEGSISGGSAGGQILSALDVKSLFSGLQIGSGLVDYVVGLLNDVYGIVNKSGVQMLIFLSGLQSISPAIYESCHIDGASSWETFWKITFPMISPMILVNAVYTVIDSFTSETNSVMQHISQTYEQIGPGEEIATAMSWMYFLVIVLLLAVVAGILGAYVFYQRKDV